MNKEFLKSLLETASPSGFERKAAALWRGEAEKFADLVYGDAHGNSIAKVAGRDNQSSLTKIMLAGHIDEIGLMISYVDPDGFLFFRTVGGFDLQILPGQRVRIYTRSGKIVKGCIGRLPIHLLSEEQKKQVVKVEELWIDVGGKEKSGLVGIGDYAMIDYRPEFLSDNILVARGLDDRVGAFVVLEALKKIEKNNLRSTVYAVATVQEEIGLRGAITSAYGIAPKIGIAVDVTFASDHPRADKTRGDIKMGNGPVISVGPNITPSVYELLVATAEELEIPYQIEAAPRATGTDANVIQLTREGVATGLVSIPSRYMHSPCEMINLKDVENSIRLIARFCEKIS